MLFETLSRLGSKAERILFYPESWDLTVLDSHDRDSQLLVKAQEAYGVKLIPTEMEKPGDQSWNATFSKFLAWDQTQYDRVLHLDTDLTLFKHLDELFLLPSTQIAMMRAYWDLPDKKALSSKLIVIEPSHSEYERLLQAGIAAQIQGEAFDMHGLNRFYDDSALVLPHIKYGLTSGEFRSEDHKDYLGRSGVVWDPEKVMMEASLVHFSDDPFPKPWIMWPRNLLGEKLPPCKRVVGDKEDCRDKKIWLGLYDDFRQRRKVCHQDSKRHVHFSNRFRMYVDFFRCLLQNGHSQINQTPLRVPKRITLLSLSLSASI